MPVASLSSIPHSGESHPWSTLRFVKVLILRHISPGLMSYGLKKQTITQLLYSIVADWQLVMIGAGALWGRLMGQIRRRTAHLSATYLSSIPNPPGILTLLFSCIATAWLTGYCILRKKLSDGKKADFRWNPPHLKYRLTDKVLIFKYMQLN